MLPLHLLKKQLDMRTLARVALSFCRTRTYGPPRRYCLGECPSQQLKKVQPEQKKKDAISKQRQLWNNEYWFFIIPTYIARESVKMPY